MTEQELANLVLLKMKRLYKANPALLGHQPLKLMVTFPDGVENDDEVFTGKIQYLAKGLLSMVHRIDSDFPRTGATATDPETNLSINAEHWEDDYVRFFAFIYQPRKD